MRTQHADRGALARWPACALAALLAHALAAWIAAVALRVPPEAAGAPDAVQVEFAAAPAAPTADAARAEAAAGAPEAASEPMPPEPVPPEPTPPERDAEALQPDAPPSPVEPLPAPERAAVASELPVVAETPVPEAPVVPPPPLAVSDVTLPAPTPAVRSPPRPHDHMPTRRPIIAPVPRSTPAKPLRRVVRPTEIPTPRAPHREAAGAPSGARRREGASASASAASTAAPAAAPSVGAPGPDLAAVASWRTRVMAHLNRFKRPPPGGGTGTAGVRFTIARGGEVLSAGLLRSAGDPNLDQEAVALVRRASPVPAPPEGFGASTGLTVPVRFDR